MSSHNLRTAQAVRERCANITRAVRAGESEFFRIDDAALSDAARLVQQVTDAQYPDGEIPYHSRWRHFEAGGFDRADLLQSKLREQGQTTHRDIAQAHIDLTVVSVLLDAGAGDQWRYNDPQSGQVFSRSEGLGVASFNGFIAGMFSASREHPCRVDAAALCAIDSAQLGRVFQVSDDNPLLGLAERAELIRRLGSTLAADTSRFGQLGRPGDLFNRLTANGTSQSISATQLLTTLLDDFSDVWMTGNRIDDTPLGDCWQHPLAGGEGAGAGWVPFHKLSQWLTYSLLEPFEAAGVSVQGLDELTGLPEYRNGGLLIDAGVIVPHDSDLLTQPMKVSDLAVIEWRAMTVTLLDELADRYRDLVGAQRDELPLARILEGGTWAAGRKLAAQKRQGLPPLNIMTDGTVF
jgi:hypothetical protein